jgi:hypothetical protein
MTKYLNLDWLRVFQVFFIGGMGGEFFHDSSNNAYTPLYYPYEIFVILIVCT